MHDRSPSSNIKQHLVRHLHHLLGNGKGGTNFEVKANWKLGLLAEDKLTSVGGTKHGRTHVFASDLTLREGQIPPTYLNRSF